MKYLKSLLGAVLATTIIIYTAAAKPMDYLQSAMAKTRLERYQEAIEILKTGEQYYQRQGDQRRAYASKALAMHLQKDIDYRRRQRTGEAQPDNATEGTRLGSCLGDDCSYGVEWYAPSPANKKYGGILVLHKNLRHFKDARGLPQPLWGVMDVRVIPALGKDENVQVQCTDKTKKISSGQILAITADSQRSASSTVTLQVKQAWAMNIRSGHIDDLPASSIKCEIDLP
jgi:hypothetical protein